MLSQLTSAVTMLTNKENMTLNTTSVLSYGNEVVHFDASKLNSNEENTTMLHMKQRLAAAQSKKDCTTELSSFHSTPRNNRGIFSPT
jgi:hypothetical protein